MKKFSDFLEGRCWPGYKPKPGKQPYSPGSCVKEDWSQKYKSSIDCNNPKGFSQKAHCAGKKKRLKEMLEQHCEKGKFKPVKPYSVSNVTPRPSSDSAVVKLKEDLRNWFNPNHPKGGWKRVNSKGEVVGDCAREPGEPKPKCMSNAQRASLSKKERASAVRRKRREDPNPERQGEPINVKSKVNENMEQLDEKNKPTNPELWSRAITQAKSKFDVYPSAYANGWASKWYKEHGGGWKSVSEASEVGDDPINQGSQDGVVKKGGKTVITKTLSQMKEAKEKTEYDYEGDMARGQLQSIINNSQRVHDMLEDNDNLPEWVQSKITLAEDYISTVANYLMSELDEGAVPSTEKVVTVRHKTSGKELVVTAQKAKEYQKQGYHAVNEEIEEIEEMDKSQTPPGRDGGYQFPSGPKASKKDIKSIQKDPVKHLSNLFSKEYAKKKMKEEVEQIEEGRPSQRHPLEGHEYHKKSDEALVHIAKDAHAAAEAMKGHNTTAENKYRDQANDSATVRHYRKTHGMADWYKKKYGHMNEAVEKDTKPPFDAPYTKRKSTGPIVDKSGAKHSGMSIARHLARTAAQKQAGNMKTEEKEKSRKAQIVKSALKGKDKFEKDPIITDTTVKTDNLQ